MSELSPQRHWNTWRSEYPAQMMHLPLGLTVTPTAYAAASRRFTDFPAIEGGVNYGPREIDGRYVTLSTELGGTGFTWRWDQPGDGILRGSWQATSFGEWGLRFWLMPVFAVEGRDDIDWLFDETAQILHAEIDGQHVAVIGAQPPLMATFHEDRAALGAEFTEHGYFYLGSRGIHGRTAVLRYNFDEMPRMSFAIGLGASSAEAIARARAGLAAPEPVAPAIRDDKGGLDALRDIVGWNSVHDFINHWPYMSLSRTWVAQKFGGFGLWLTDIFYHALATGLFDAGMAKESIKAVLATETPQGNLACLITGRDRWVDRSQPPVCSFILWKIWRHTGDDSLIDLAFTKLLRNHDWWFAHRDAPEGAVTRGLMNWGTSPGIGDGLYRNTKLGAKNESSMDNSPIHDEAAFDPASGCLDSADIGLNALLVLDAEVLADWAKRRGDAATTDRLLTRAAALRRKIGKTLWDNDRNIFANRRWSGAFIRSIAPTSFYPMLADAASPAQRDGLVAALADPAKFGGKWRLPSVTRDDPAYRDNVYWRGRIWPPLNYLTYQGLKRAGFEDEATLLAQDTSDVFQQAWANRQCPENFSAETGAADDQPDTDLFYGWGVLMPITALNETIDVTPWHGWEITHRAGDWQLGPLLAFGRSAELVAKGGRFTLKLDGKTVFATDIPGRFRQVEIGAGRIAFEPPSGGGHIYLPGNVIHASYGGTTLVPQTIASETVVTLPAGKTRRLCEIEYSA